MVDNISVLRLSGIGITLILGILFLYLQKKSNLVLQSSDNNQDKPKKSKKYFILGVVFLWLCSGLIMGIFHQAPSEALHVQMTADRMNFLGFEISSSVFIGWIAMLIVIIPVLLIRILVIPKFSEKPGTLQVVLEMAVTSISDYTKEKSDTKSHALNAYMLALALYMVACAITELFSFRPPTSDIVATFSLALVTFVMINYYGLKKKGFGGRILSFAKPVPVVFPFRILSDIAVPVSLACRLFGNMLGGMIVMHLIYQVLGSFGVGIPAVLGLYFNVFHPLIQVFIFITLSLTFIGEAVENN